jgi:hypothetical protein
MAAYIASRQKAATILDATVTLSQGKLSPCRVVDFLLTSMNIDSVPNMQATVALA